MQLPDVPVEEWDQYQSDVFRNDTDQRIASLPLHVAPIRDDWMQPGAFAPDSTLPISSENQSLGALARGPITVPPVEPQAPSDASADETILPNTENQSLQAQARIANQNAGFGLDYSGTLGADNPVVARNIVAVSDSGAGGSSLPAPDAPLPTDFGTHADARIASLSPPASPASANTPPAGQATSSTVNGVSGPPDLVAAAMNAADAVGVDPNLYVSLIQQESSFNPRAGSGAGAQGLAQLMPATARGLGVTDPWDPIQSLQGGARFLKQQLDTFGGDVVKALAAYNAGPGAVQKYGGIPPYEETQRYVKQVMGRLSDEPIDTSQITGIPGTQAPGATEGVQRAGSGLEPKQASGYTFPVADYQGDVNLHWGDVPGGSDLFAPRGTPVVAMRGGKVLEAGYNSIGGNSVLIQGDDGNQYYYAHFDKAPSVKTGQPVTAGTYLGPVGNTGDAANTGTHLHIGIGPSILLGADKYGGTGGKFDAVGLLRTALADQRTPQTADAAAGPAAIAPALPATPAQDVNPFDWLARQKDSLAAGIGEAASSLGNTVSGAASSIFGPQSADQPAVPQPPPASSMTPPQPQQSVWDRVGQGISDVFKNVFGGGSSSTPPPPPEGGGYGAVPPGGQNPLDQIGRGISSAASNMLGQINLTDPSRSVIGGNPVAPATMPTSTQLIQHAEEQKNRAIEENNPLRDVPLIGGLTTGVAQAIDPLMFAAGPLLGTAAGALPVGAGLAGTLARGAVQGAGYGAIQGATQPEADIGSTLRGAAEGAGLGLAAEGGVAALERFKPSEVARAATGPPPEGVSKRPTIPSVPEGARPTAVEQTLDSGLVIPRSGAPLDQPVQIMGPRGELLSTVASREVTPGVGVIRSEAGAAAIGEPSTAALDRMPNLSKMATDMPEVQATIQRVAEENPELINAFRQGRVTNGQLINDLAPRLGMTAEDFLKTSVGRGFNPEETLALRAAVVQKQAQAVQLAQDIADKGGVGSLTDAEKAGAIGQIVDAARLQAVARGAASTAGRTLNQQKIAIDRAMAQAITGGNEAIAAQRALNAAKAKAAWVQQRLAALDQAGGTTSASARAQLRREMTTAGQAAGQEVRTAAQPAIGAYTDTVNAARADLKATNHYLEDTFDTQLRQLDQEAAKRAGKAAGAQGEGERAWLTTQAKAAQQEANAADLRMQRAFDTEMRVRDRQQEQAGRILDALGGRKVTDDMLRQFVDLQRSGDTLAAAKFLRGLANTSVWDRVNILRYGSMLSSTATHLTNSLGNTLQLGLDVGLKPLAAGIDAARAGITGGPRTRYLAEVPQQLRGMVEGALAGWKDAGVVMRTGVSPQTAGKLEQVRGGFNSGNAVVDTIAEAPLRALEAADLIFRGAARGGQTRALAMRQALQEGYSGASAASRTDQIMQNLTDFPTLLSDAEKGAARVVLQETRPEILGLSRRPQGIAGVAQSIFLPFVRTPYNIAAQGAGMTPAGFLGALKAARAGDTGEAADRAARAVFGTGVMTVAGALGMGGYLTGATPTDAGARSTLPPGWKPWSVRIPRADGAVYIGYQNLGPIGVPIAIAAVMTEAARQGQPFDPTRAVAGLGKYMVDQTFLQGVNALVQAIEEPDRYLENLTEGLASSFVPYGGLQRQIERAVGMADRDPHGAMEALLATSLPTAGMVQPRTTALGEPVQQAQTGAAVFASPLRYDVERDTPVLRALREADVAIPGTPKKLTVRGGEIPLTLTEQKQLEAQRGQKIQQYVAADLKTPSYQALNAVGRKKRLAQIVSNASSQVDTAFVNTMPANTFEQRRVSRAVVPYQVGP